MDLATLREFPHLRHHFHFDLLLRRHSFHPPPLPSHIPTRNRQPPNPHTPTLFSQKKSQFTHSLVNLNGSFLPL